MLPRLSPIPQTKSLSKGVEKSVRKATSLSTKLSKLSIHAPFDLILHFPLRYVDETRVTPIAEARENELVQIQGEVIDAKVLYRPRRILTCKVRDDSGLLTLLFFNFYPSQVRQLAVGAKIRVLGEPRQGQMVHPQCRAARPSSSLPQTLTPVYSTTAGLSQSIIRGLIEKEIAKQELSDTLPSAVLQPLKLPTFSEAVKALHYPQPNSGADLIERSHPAWQRVKFDELLAQQLSLRRAYQLRRGRSAPLFAPPGKTVRRLLGMLPFQLTRAQRRVWQEIAKDLAIPHPMQRLLQGDVGSGKTIVAALAALQAIENNTQVALMVPTEILSEQHYRKLSALFAPLGIAIIWLTAALKGKEKKEALQAISKGDAPLIIGTHALIQDQVTFHKLGLLIIDEQHRFGVEQRLALQKKGIKEGRTLRPHQLMMSATPIPRTLAMSYYADLDVSVIDELPKERVPIVTKLIADNRRHEVIARIRTACLSGEQAYWVCPLIEESEALQLQTALDTYAKLKETFPELNIGLIHGRLAQKERAEVMNKFAENKIQLLVATTVIEVGIDVPNASLMVIEHAERFGLSQLHQLRGRVGRGNKESVCILIYKNPLSDNARQRLKTIYEHADGFEVARQDLMLRGPGEFIGIRQSGVPLLRFADLNTDQVLLEKARKVAELLLRDYSQHAQQHLDRWLGSKYQYLKT